jgi:soluble lytic murein transglycosylase-like protein
VPPALRGLILAAAARERLPPAVLAAQMRAESGFSPTAVSRVGAQGIAQFMPATWAGSWNPWRGASPFDPAAAIPAQARYLRRLLDAVGGDLAHALAAYNAGLAGSAGGPAAWPAETRAYVATILRGAGLAAAGGVGAGSTAAGRVPVVGGALAVGGVVAAAALGGLDELRPRLVG